MTNNPKERPAGRNSEGLGNVHESKIYAFPNIRIYFCIFVMIKTVVEKHTYFIGCAWEVDSYLSMSILEDLKPLWIPLSCGSGIELGLSNLLLKPYEGFHAPKVLSMF